MRGILHTDDFSWTVAPRGKGGGSGGGTNTVTQQSGPPAEVLANYSQVYNQGKNVAAQPYPTYNGALVAGLQPQQVAGFNNVNTAVNAAQPFLNAASQYTTNAAGAMDPATFQATQANYQNPALQGYINQAQGQIGNTLGTSSADVNAALQRLYGGVGTTLQDMQGGVGNTLTGMQGGVGNALTGMQAGVGNALTGMQGGIGNALNESGQGVGLSQGTAAQFNPTNFGNTVGNYYNPYAESVIAPTQRLFNEQNAQQLSQVRGNAGAQGAFGGDREAIAEAETARQQKLAQDPVLAQLQSTGYAQAVQNALAAGAQGQQAAGLTLQGAGQGLQGATSLGQAGLQGATSLGQAGLQGATSLGQAGLQGATSLGQAGLQGATAESQAGLQGGLGLGGLGMTGAGQYASLGNLSNQGYNAATGALQSDAWLNSNAGFGMGNLGQEVQNLGLSGANALISSGGMQQQQAQAELNAPYQQWLAAQGYPFQTTGWLEGLATGTGALSGSQGSTTQPAPSTASQIAGLGLTGAGILGQTGAFGGANGSPGWLSNMFNSGSAASGAGGFDAFAGNTMGAARGGRISGLAAGGTTLPFDPDVPALDDVPDLSISVIPQPNPMAASSSLLKPTGSTTTTTGGGGSGGKDSIFGSLLKGAGTIAAGVYGGPAGAAGASLLGSQVHFGHGGRIPRRDLGGGISPDPVNMFGGNPNAAAMYQRYDSLPTEHLRELAQRAPNDPYIRRAIMQRQMAPQSDPAQQPPAQMAGLAAPSGFADGGEVDDSADGADVNLMPYAGESGLLPSSIGTGAPMQLQAAPQPQAGLAPPPPDTPAAGAPSPQVPPADIDAQAQAGLGATPPQSDAGAGAEGAPQRGAEHGFPWGTLTAAGLGIMGGTSPHAAVNIGRGGLEGLKYAEAMRLREAQMENNRLWHQGMVGAAQRRAATGEERAGTYATSVAGQNAARQATAGDKAATLDARVEALRASAVQRRAAAAATPENAASRRMSAEGLRDYRIGMLEVARINGDTRALGVLGSNEFKKVQAEHMQWQQTHGDATLAMQAAHLDQVAKQHLSDQDFRVYLGTKDALGRVVGTPAAAHQTGQAIRNMNAGPAQGGGGGLPKWDGQEPLFKTPDGRYGVKRNGVDVEVAPP